MLEASLPALHLPKSHTEAIMCIPQIITYMVREKGMYSTNETKVSFSRTMVQALELLQLAKRLISGQSNVEQWRNQAFIYSHYWVMLVWRQLVRESSVSPSLENLTTVNRKFLKSHSNFLEWVRYDLKTFLSLAMPNLYCLNLTK